MDDHARVAELLGRRPSGDFEVVVRDAAGDPVVIANAPLLDDGTPMPTRYWLVGRDEVAAVSMLEAAGGVREAERAVDADDLADAHRRYQAMRDELVPGGHDGPRPSGGVGGTAAGVKCLHAHYAWHLAGGDDPVGRWVAQALAAESTLGEAVGEMSVDVGAADSTVNLSDGRSETIDLGFSAVAAELAGSDPPRPEQLTNALGVVADRLEDLIVRWPFVAGVHGVEMSGPAFHAIVGVEVGADDVAFPFCLACEAAEDVFRTVATEPREARLHNPGLRPEQVDDVVAACCIVVAVSRRLQLESVIIR